MTQETDHLIAETEEFTEEDINAPSTVTLCIHDDIGDGGITSKDFIEAVNDIPEGTDIHLSINSYGGNALEALTIYNVLVSHPSRITARVEGYAASAASVILMAANHIVIPQNAYIMIHNPASIETGEADQMRATADRLENMEDRLVHIYSNRTGQPEDVIRQMMDAETWMDGIEAVALGFADEDEVATPIEAIRTSTITASFKKLPPALASINGFKGKRIKAKKLKVKGLKKKNSIRASATLIAEMCTAINAAHLINDFIRQGISATALTERIEDVKAIRQLGQISNNAYLAEQLISDGVPVATARRCFNALKHQSAVSIQSATRQSAYSLPSASPPSAKSFPHLDHREIYANRKGGR